MRSFKNKNKHRISTWNVGNFSTLLKRVVIVCGALSSLSGCEEIFAPNIADICNDNPHLCNDLNTDSWCRSEKAEIVNHRFRYQQQLTSQQQYNLMILFENYKACITKASGIEHIKYREKESERMKGVITAQRELKRLSRATRNDPHPLLSYYHWSRYGDEKALERFMTANREGKLNTPELLIALASVQVKYDLEQTRKTLFQALSLYKDDKNIDVEVFPTLVTIALEQEKYAQAYLWSIVAEEYKAQIATNDKLVWAKRFNLDTNRLEEIADEVIDALDEGNFDARKFALNRI
ncbi:DUF2989 domain-containing protein [Alteromonas ponticola]|uniref:DUF2989 domain-containing protein n=1 Tax=Alteromonas aquimaris TaxID=2998417 RepID=A0ABT3P796_9ALTE|nr:DUF2989 domain-containing protein [Alteromonas aquimaris]MCW8108640.1 DUF2989 domain-containing protein [Alteromonas aquimaris]